MGNTTPCGVVWGGIWCGVVMIWRGLGVVWCGVVMLCRGVGVVWCGGVCSQNLRRVEFGIEMSGFGKLINPPTQTQLNTIYLYLISSFCNKPEGRI
jgi:hypothetical protein